MRVVLKTLVLAGNVGREIIAITVRSDDADHDEEGSRSVTDLDNQDFDISFEPEPVSEIEESKIKAVMEQSSCTRDHAFNALLSHDWNIEAAELFLEENMEEVGTVSDTSSCPPVTKPLPSGRQWGECQSDLSSVHFGVSSQHGDNADPSQNNIGEQVVVTARLDELPFREYPAHSLGIRTENDGITFRYTADDSWAENHTDLPRYNHLRYRFLKINSRSVQNCVELDEALSSLSLGDTVTFTLAKTLFSQGEGIGELFLACVSGDAKIVKRILENNPEIDINKTLKGSYADLQKYGEDVEEGYTALMVASENGNAAVVRELLCSSKIQVNTRDREGRTVLSKVSEKGLSDVVRLLLAHPDIDVNKQDCKFVINEGAIDTPDESVTPLLAACYEGHLEVVQQLIERTDIEMNKVHYDSPLSASCKLCHPKVVELLLARGAKMPNWDPKTGGSKNYRHVRGFRDYEPEIQQMLEAHAKLHPDQLDPDREDQKKLEDRHPDEKSKQTEHKKENSTCIVS